MLTQLTEGYIPVYTTDLMLKLYINREFKTRVRFFASELLRLNQSEARHQIGAALSLMKKELLRRDSNPQHTAYEAHHDCFRTLTPVTTNSV